MLSWSPWLAGVFKPWFYEKASDGNMIQLKGGVEGEQQVRDTGREVRFSMDSKGKIDILASKQGIGFHLVASRMVGGVQCRVSLELSSRIKGGVVMKRLQGERK